MNIDEAIKHCENVASGHERNCEIFTNDCELWQINKEWADNYHHIAEWLKELKAYREAREEIIRKRDSSQWSELVVHGFSHAIYTIDNHLKEVNADECNL
jgi:hypothetical protein